MYTGPAFAVDVAGTVVGSTGPAAATDNTAGTITFVVTILVVVSVGAVLALRSRRNR